MNNDFDPKDPQASNQLYREIHSIVSRYADESDLTLFETIGALEAVKADYLAARAKSDS
jgi:hypothetical protein